MTTRNIVIVFALLVLVAFIVGIAKDSKPAVNIPVVPVTTTPTSIDLCYYNSTKTSRGFYDRAWIRLEITGDTVSGEFNNYPAEKDSKVGTFEGSVPDLSGRPASPDPSPWKVVWHTKAEGMTADEELLIKYTTMNAQVGFGEMVQGANGVYVYRNESAAVYQAPIPAIDCVNLDEIVAVEKYIRANIATIVSDKAVLGGTWYTTAVNVDATAHTAAVSYEDGHIAGKGTVSYTYDLTTKKITVNSFTKAK